MARKLVNEFLIPKAEGRSAKFFRWKNGYYIPAVITIIETYKRPAMAFNFSKENLFNDLLIRYGPPPGTGSGTKVACQ